MPWSSAQLMKKKDVTYQVTMLSIMSGKKAKEKKMVFTAIPVAQSDNPEFEFAT